MSASSPEAVAKFFKSVKERGVAGVRELLSQGIDPNCSNKQGETPIMAAALTDNLELFDLLQQAGADLGARTKDGNLTLFRAARCKHGNEAVGLSMVQRVINSAGLGPDQQKFSSALVLCAADRSPDYLGTLVRLGADPNYRTDDGACALLRAIWENRPDAVAALLEAGADPNSAVPPGKVFSWLESIPRRYWERPLLDLADGKRLREIAELLAKAGGRAKSRNPVEDVATSWEKIERWLRTRAPSWNPLQPGAANLQIDEAQTRLNLSFLEDLRISYGRHDGSQDFFPGVDTNRYLMPLSEVVQHAKMLGENLDGNEFAGIEIRADIGISPVFWHKAWIPFVSNGGGDYYCVDLAPSEKGEIGQILAFHHENGERWLVAPSLRTWLSELAEELQNGRLRYEEGKGLVSTAT